MTKQDKELLLKDLCARLPYGVKVQYNNEIYNIDYISALYEEVKLDIPDTYTIGISEIKPYLQPMESMTEDEFGFLQEHLAYDFTRIYSGNFDLINDIHLGNSVSIDDMSFLLDCLNKWHFDYRGLIHMGLALPATEGMYNF